MNMNRWVAKDDLPDFACWYAGFPEDRMDEDWELLPYLQQVLDAAEREQVFKVMQVPHIVKRFNGREQVEIADPKLQYHRQPGGPTYAQFLELVLAETGVLLFFDHGLSTSPGCLPKYRVFASAQLSYYDSEGQLVEGEVEDVGELLQQVRPLECDIPNWQTLSEEELAKERRYINRRYKSEGPSLYFMGRAGVWSHRGRKQIFSPGRLSIRLYTDIWFPQVYGFLEPDFSGRKALYDNRELALRHTPRLNRFLASVKELTLECGGTWEMDDTPDFTKYLPMKNENGIILDI